MNELFGESNKTDTLDAKNLAHDSKIFHFRIFVSLSLARSAS